MTVVELDVDLLGLTEQRPPLGGLGWVTRSGRTRAHWVPPLDGEEDTAPRIVHARTLQLHAPAELSRLGVSPGQGYHKCGSGNQWDWVRSFRLLIWDGASWQVVLEEAGLPEPAGADAPPLWFSLDGLETAAAIIEVRSSGLDRGWSPWNLASSAFKLMGRVPQESPTRVERRLRLAGIEPVGSPDGVTAAAGSGEVRFTTDRFQVGFALGRPGFSFLALDDTAQGRVDRDLLYRSPGVELQGPMLHPVGSSALVAPALRCDLDGEVEVRGNRVVYRLAFGQEGHAAQLAWRVLPDRLELEVERTSPTSTRAWDSSVWQTAFDASKAAVSTVGELTQAGQVGMLDLPTWVHAPGHGTLAIQGLGGANATWRSDADRPNGWITGELKVGERAHVEGDHELLPGTHRAELALVARTPGARATTNAPRPVADALARSLITGMTYRADTGTLSNNGVSIHCPMSMDTWSAQVVQLSHVVPELPALDLLRCSLERWLGGGPGYASGWIRRDDGIGLAEDEYLITGSGTLLGLADYLANGATSAWLERYAPAIRQRLQLMQGRDLDGDGLVESRQRRGVSGEHDWSTNWYDVVSFGWKDAFTNALLYRALRGLDAAFEALGAADLRVGLDEWARRLRSNYHDTFYNPETGWIAGWVSADGVRHDYRFMAINGAASWTGVLEDDVRRAVMKQMLADYRASGAPSAELGLPVCLSPVHDDDLTEVMAGYPHGFYLNGGLSLSQSRHVVAGLFAAGLDDPAEELLSRLCASLADGTAFGGSQSGVDWRYWDGGICGYEGLLTEQFGLLAVAMERYAVRA